MRLHASRIPVAVLIAALCGASIGGTMGLVSAAGEEELQEFSVAMPMADDRWSYGLTAEIYEGDESLLEHANATYEYGAVDVWRTAEGVHRPAIPLQEQISWEEADGGLQVDDTGYMIDALDGSPLGMHGHEALNWTTRGANLLGLLASGPQATRVEVVAETIDYRATTPFCGYRSPLQSTTPISTEGPIVFPGTCFADAAELGLSADPVFHALGVENLDGHDALHLRSIEGNTTTDAWLSPDVPYPVRIVLDHEWDLGALFGEEAGAFTVGVRITWDLVGFEPGSQPFDADVELPADIQVSPIELAPRQVWGPDESGVNHVYPLSEAFNGALTDPTYPDLRNFMQNHPGAAVVHAEYHLDEHDDGSTDHVWRFIVAGNEELHETTASRNVPAAGAPQSILGSVMGSSDRHQNSGGAFLSVMVQFYASPDELPAKLPTVASMMQRYEDLQGRDGNAWSWSAICFFGCGFNLDAGHSERTYEEGDATGNGASYSGSTHTLNFDEAGTVLALRMWDEEGRTSTGVAPSPVVSSEPVLRSQIAMAAMVWQAPPPEAVASAGFLGLLIGALYWLWPTLKALPLFSLFSRIQKDDLLDHPIRQALLDHVEAKPGVHYQALVQQLGKGRGVVEHHLRKLEAGGILQTKRTKGYTCYYVKGKLDNRVMEALPAIKSATASTILQTIIERPGTTAKELSAAIGISPSTASHHISKLRQVGLLDASGTRNAQLLPTGIARDAMAARMT